MSEEKQAEVKVQSQSVQNTIEFIKFGVALEQAIVKAKQNDGKINAADLPLLFPVVPLIGPALSDIGSIPKELSDLDEAEADEIISAASDIFGGMENAKVVLKIKAALNFAHAGYKLYIEFAKK